MGIGETGFSLTGKLGRAEGGEGGVTTLDDMFTLLDPR